MAEQNNIRCAATRSDKSPCRAPVRPGRPYCTFHDPLIQDDLKEARRLGGKRRSNIQRSLNSMPDELRDLLTRLLTAVDEVADGRLTPAQAQAMARLAATYIAGHNATALTELQNQEARLKRLEASA